MTEEPGNSGARRRQNRGVAGQNGGKARKQQARRRQNREAAGQDGGKARKQQGETAEEPGNSGGRRQQSWEIAGQDGGRMTAEPESPPTLRFGIHETIRGAPTAEPYQGASGSSRIAPGNPACWNSAWSCSADAASNPSAIRKVPVAVTVPSSPVVKTTAMGLPFWKVYR